MAIYIALLRAVNVGQNVIKMERLRELWSQCGCKNVTTYIQSGNVVFEAEGSPANWSQAIEQRLAGETRLPVSVILRTPAELKGIIARNPFLRDALKKLSAVNAGGDQFRLSGKEVYLYCPEGYGRSKLSNAALERALSVKATTRNWNTVNKLDEIASSSSAAKRR